MAEAPATDQPSVDPVVDPIVACRGLTKAFGPVTPVDPGDLEVHEGELLALLGPSGCGKTTFLRLVAGFERPDAGTVTLAGTEMGGPRRHVPPERRHVGVVFQDYALFPHLTVAANVGYGITDRHRRAPRVDEVLELVGLRGAAHRYPHELSGGQQQRVALARALAPEPAIVLLDEPFSNLDAALRGRVRDEVRGILQRAGQTAVIVTHDQEEALSLADRVAVMRAGQVLQVGAPHEIYAHPADPFVASFVGDADLVWGEVRGDRITTEVGPLVPAAPVEPDNGRALVVLRAEAVQLRLDGASRAVVRDRTYFGHDQLVEVALASGVVIRSRMGPGRSFEPGDRVRVSVTGPVVAFPAPPDGDSDFGEPHLSQVR